MNYRTLLGAAAAMAIAAGLLLGQATGQAPPPQPAGQPPAAAPPGAAPPVSTTPVAPQPAVASQEEANALTAVWQAQDADARIKAGVEFLQKFPATEFKALANLLITLGYQEKNDYEHTIVYGEETLKADPAHFQAMLLLARTIALRTRENDLDKEEKLANAEKYANLAIETLKTAPRPNPAVTDAQWAQAKTELQGQAFEALGMVAAARNKFDDAIALLRKSIAVSAGVDPSTLVRLGNVLAKAGKYDEAIATFDKVLAMPDAVTQVKDVAQAERDRATQAKAKGAKPPAP